MKLRALKIRHAHLVKFPFLGFNSSNVCVYAYYRGLSVDRSSGFIDWLSFAFRVLPMILSISADFFDEVHQQQDEICYLSCLTTASCLQNVLLTNNIQFNLCALSSHKCVQHERIINKHRAQR